MSDLSEPCPFPTLIQRFVATLLWADLPRAYARTLAVVMSLVVAVLGTALAVYPLAART